MAEASGIWMKENWWSWGKARPFVLFSAITYRFVDCVAG